jgi:hypothetical protein
MKQLPDNEFLKQEQFFGNIHVFWALPETFAGAI